MQVLDVGDPTAPAVAGALAVPGVLNAVSEGAGRLWMSSDFVHWAPGHCGPVSGTGGLPAAGPVSLRAYPNPFNPRTLVSFDLPAALPVNLAVYDLAGRRVRTIVAGDLLGEGEHTRTWLGRDEQGRAVASGVYFWRLEAGEIRATQRVTLVR